MNKETIANVEKTISTMDRATVMIKGLSQQLDEANRLLEGCTKTNEHTLWIHQNRIKEYLEKYKLIENKQKNHQDNQGN